MPGKVIITAATLAEAREMLGLKGLDNVGY